MEEKRAGALTETSHLRSLDGGTGKENEIYRRRFSAAEELARDVTWKVLCRDFFQRYVPQTASVLDLGAGDGRFITNISAGRRIAVDLSSHVQQLEGKGIEVVVSPASQFRQQISERIDIIFVSNFLEHLPTKKAVLETLEECRKALKPDGRLLILQPNIRYVGSAYWDYIDHHIEITEHSLVEALEVVGFKVEELIPRFLPYTVKSLLGKWVNDKSPWLVAWYLKIPLLWRIFGQQTFVVAKPLWSSDEQK